MISNYFVILFMKRMCCTFECSRYFIIKKLVRSVSL